MTLLLHKIKLLKMQINDYVSGLNTNLQKAYYTALGRERYGLYRQKLIINPS